jgi:hypothetical protein
VTVFALPSAWRAEAACIPPAPYWLHVAASPSRHLIELQQYPEMLSKKSASKNTSEQDIKQKSRRIGYGRVTFSKKKELKQSQALQCAIGTCAGSEG